LSRVVDNSQNEINLHANIKLVDLFRDFTRRFCEHEPAQSPRTIAG
jgi:hypothetical protein